MSVCNGLKAVTNYRTPSLQAVNNKELTDDLNMCSVDLKRTLPLPTPAHPHQKLPYAHLRPGDRQTGHALQAAEDQEVSGADKVSPSGLNVCTDQLAPVVTKTFNRSLEQCEVPSCFKSPPSPQSPRNQQHWNRTTISLML